MRAWETFFELLYSFFGLWLYRARSDRARTRESLIKAVSMVDNKRSMEAERAAS